MEPLRHVCRQDFVLLFPWSIELFPNATFAELDTLFSKANPAESRLFTVTRTLWDLYYGAYVLWESRWPIILISISLKRHS
jgi:hypothetical protein